MSKSYYETNGYLHIDSDCEEIMLVYTDSKNNNNKFYHLIYNNGVATATYGRVGAKGSKTDVGHSLSVMHKKAEEKFRKGYRPVELQKVEETSVKHLINQNLSNIALDNLIDNKTKTDPKKSEDLSILTDLIKKLVESNKHEIHSFSGGKITIDDNGLVKTALGVITLETLQKASDVLLKIKSELDNKTTTGNYTSKYYELLNSYLELIPQVVPPRAGWGDYFFTSYSSFEKQEDFLEQLKSSVNGYNDLVKKAKENEEKNKSKSDDEKEKVVLFNKTLKVVSDKKILKRINDYFESTKNQQHTSRYLKIKQVFEIVDNKAKKQFDKVAQDLGNLQFYWHGTRKYNILSILKQGILIPKSNSFNVTGRMFGDGVYLSNQSTKALNYSQGYWDRNDRSSDSNCFMFLADVAMGKVFEASHYKAKEYAKNRMYPINGFDSVIARGGKNNYIHAGYDTRLMNDEMIVYDTKQLNLRYLVEFEE